MDKKVAKRVVEMLNGQQMGGRRRSAHYYDLWSMKVIESCRGSLCSVSFHQKCSQCPRGLLDHYDSSEACFGGRYGQDGSVYARCIVQYLPKFKWDYLTEEAVYKQKVREQKLAVELSAAKRERDFYMQKVGER